MADFVPIVGTFSWGYRDNPVLQLWFEAVKLFINQDVEVS
jgi:hypothetical protein